MLHSKGRDSEMNDSIPGGDSAMLRNSISEIVITAFEENKKISDQPAPIAYLSSAAISRYGNTELLSALNAVPGIRMEERSPGSYRLNIRGSSLRSPFGVRNVKIYYNGMPLTDPGGNTYLNQLSPEDYGSLTIIKGPAGSLYGAGTGGTMLIQSPLYTGGSRPYRHIDLGWESGSYGLRHLSAALGWGDSSNASELRYSHYSSDGYRQQTALHSDIASYETRLKKNDQEELDGFFHYTDLYYQTPGALTLSEFQKDPRSARPTSGGFPSAVESRAAVYQKAFFMGLKNDYRIEDNLRNTTVLYGSYTDFINPTTRNYEYRKEPHFGGRTVFEFDPYTQKIQSRFWLGGEMQQGFFSVKDFGNEAGSPDTLQTENRIDDFAALLFGQAEFSDARGWDLTAGLSLYHENLRFTSLYPSPVLDFNKKYHGVLSPRVVLSKKLLPGILVYAGVSKGFSPPSVDEILPSTTVLNTRLQAEQGMNYEVGSKGHLFHQKLYYDVSAFLLNLTQSISLRRDSSGADYFVNAGSAMQKGIETSLSYHLYRSPHTFFSGLDLWATESYLDYKYRNYLSDCKDYSGKRIPGAAPLTLAGGIDLRTRVRLQAHLTWQRTARIALDDANDVYAAAYNLVGIRLSYEIPLCKKLRFTLSTSGDNLLNEKYSLGDDINAAAGRYFNVAPGFNVKVDGSFQFLF